MAESGLEVWQVLPLGPPGWGGSPYASSSAFAGDAHLVSPERLVDERDAIIPVLELEPLVKTEESSE